MGTRYALCASFVALGLISSARANFLSNPGLTPASSSFDSWGLQYFNPATSSPLPGWTITGNSVDLVGSYWQAPPGATYSLDMVGTPGVGGISQTVATTPGTTYTLSFYMSFNPDNPNGEKALTKTLEVQALDGETVLADTPYSGTAGTRTEQNMQWEAQVFSFTATGTTTTLNLFAVAPSSLPTGLTSGTLVAGPAIGNLDLELASGSPSPEPASLGILGMGASALLLRRRRGR